MLSIDYIVNVSDKLQKKYKTRNPYDLCDALGIRICLKDLGTIKAFYFYQSRIRSIVLNSRVSECFQRVLIAHELGHDRLHKELAFLKGFREIALFDMALPAEYEANIFAAELLVDDKELLELLTNDNKSFFDTANELNIPVNLLDFKFRVLKHKGYTVDVPYLGFGDFLKNDLAGCFVKENTPEDDFYS